MSFEHWVVDDSPMREHLIRASDKLSKKLNTIKIEAVQAKLWAIFDNVQKEKKEGEEEEDDA